MAAIKKVAPRVSVGAAAAADRHGRDWIGQASEVPARYDTLGSGAEQAQIVAETTTGAAIQA